MAIAEEPGFHVIAQEGSIKIGTVAPEMRPNQTLQAICCMIDFTRVNDREVLSSLSIAVSAGVFPSAFNHRLFTAIANSAILTPTRILPLLTTTSSPTRILCQQNPTKVSL
jgi:hypothetical protein